jgi:NitT/TauT family transport system permease protein
MQLEMQRRMLRTMLPWLTIAALVALWHIAVTRHPGSSPQTPGASLVPGPLAVASGLWELQQRGLFLKYVVASLFRVTWGYLLAVALAIPAGLLLGWYQRAERALNPLLQILRPISPLAWIPFSILWFGVGDLAATFLIFLTSFLALTVATASAVHGIEVTHVRVGRNFGLSERQLIWRVVCPAVMPRLSVALRLTLGIAWLVLVAAEMIAVRSGLGFLIIDARNAGNRYDLVIAGMVLIGTIGIVLDMGMRRIERLTSW